MPQTTLGRHAEVPKPKENPEKIEGMAFDDYGPTKEQELPKETTIDGSPGLHPQELEGTALAPSDFELVANLQSPSLVRKQGFHPEDECREDRLEEWRSQIPDAV